MKGWSAAEDTVSNCWPKPDLILLRSSPKFPLHDLICFASVRHDVSQAHSPLSWSPSLKQCCLNCEQNVANNNANMCIFEIFDTVSGSVHFISHDKNYEGVSANIMNRHIYGKHMRLN